MAKGKNTSHLLVDIPPEVMYAVPIKHKTTEGVIMTHKATESLEAERLAAQEEGIYEPSPEQVALLKRYKQLKERRDVINTELAAIEATINRELDELNARALRVNGKNWVIVSDVNATVVDMDAAMEKYPGVFKAYQAIVVEFTSKVKKERSRRTFKPA